MQKYAILLFPPWPWWHVKNSIGKPMQKDIEKFARDCRGSVLIEYGLISAGIAIVLLSAISSLSDELMAIYQTITSGVASIGGSTG